MNNSCVWFLNLNLEVLISLCLIFRMDIRAFSFSFLLCVCFYLSIYFYFSFHWHCLNEYRPWTRKWFHENLEVVVNKGFTLETTWDSVYELTVQILILENSYDPCLSINTNQAYDHHYHNQFALYNYYMMLCTNKLI